MANKFLSLGAATDNSGGTDADETGAHIRTGADGVSTSDTTFESETANFTAADEGRGIWIGTTTPRWRMIAAYVDENTVTLDAALTTTQNNLNWKIGGSFKTLECAVDNILDGDVLYVAPGIYRDCVTIGVTPTVETIIRGDPMNTQEFKTAAGVLVEQG